MFPKPHGFHTPLELGDRSCTLWLLGPSWVLAFGGALVEPSVHIFGTLSPAAMGHCQDTETATAGIESLLICGTPSPSWEWCAPAAGSLVKRRKEASPEHQASLDQGSYLGCGTPSVKFLLCLIYMIWL